MIEQKWTAGIFLTARICGPESKAGYVYRGLGLVGHRSKRQRRPVDSWSLYHLNTGLTICHMWHLADGAFELATQIAECSEWDFEGPDGWRNRDPELSAKVIAIIAKDRKVSALGGKNETSDAAAREVMRARA